MTAEFNIVDILVALQLLTDNKISTVELQFTKEGVLVMQGKDKHLIRPRVAPIRINKNDITGSLIEEQMKNPKLTFKEKIKLLLE